MTDDSKQKDAATRAAVLESIEERTTSTTGTSRVAGKVCIVTGVGPAAGIGAQAARLLAREGAAALYLLDISKDLPGFAKELQGTFPNTKVSTRCSPSSVGLHSPSASIRGSGFCLGPETPRMNSSPNPPVRATPASRPPSSR